MIDTLLDRTIAPGYSRLGLALRKRRPGWPADPPRMDGQVVMVTGAASGLGLAAAQGFASLGATVLAVARNEERARDAEQAISGDVRGVACDVSSVAALRELAETVERLDVLVNNAGVMPGERSRSVDGVELTFATHVLGPFVLVQALAPVLEASAPARVINVTSGGMYTQALRAADLLSEQDEYNPKTFYARSKRAEVVLTEQLATRLAGTGVVVHSMHPGWADTPGIRDAMPGFRKVVGPILRNDAEGADTIVWLGAAPEPLQSTGKLWMDRAVRPTHYRFGADEDSVDTREELWRELERLAGAVV
ncbi:SDR family NAD(P)-dependent oxidoreductase [Solirubrobacter phytolaccae]|uniref:SDR family NAD(P)-dependent oxidoreductase n=1 Tax=Solirubrobacter phytolaccae TaxID=1404360 RepID=A0A9X3SEJ9_9ACTN|nr:SDR family NAD(P)-dependent oxidoreductase [Solirubrobacter phytolaccae]MDA0184970.1 SDR family NAD(P)-dependent oxidoreductase [Solirubrobacter phytolaccae]